MILYLKKNKCFYVILGSKSSQFYYIKLVFSGVDFEFKISFDFEFKIKTFDFEFKIKSEQKFRANENTAIHRIEKI